MSTDAATTAATAANKATVAANKAAEKTAAKVADLAAEKAALKFAEQFGEQFVGGALPTVVETAELAMQVPSKVVLNQKMIVVAALIGGMMLGAGALYGINKIRARKLREKLDQEVQAAVEEARDYPRNRGKNA